MARRQGRGNHALSAHKLLHVLFRELQIQQADESENAQISRVPDGHFLQVDLLEDWRIQQDSFGVQALRPLCGHIRGGRERREKSSRFPRSSARAGFCPPTIASFAHQGADSVLSLQPFGCIANQIIAKGVEKKIKTLYPNINLLSLDFDGGVSEVNIINRIHLLLGNTGKAVQ